MTRISRISFLFIGVSLVGCASERVSLPVDVPSLGIPSLGDMPFVHKIDIQQGNVVTQDMIAKLQLGMDKKKVNFVMGSPVIQDTFHENRWDYLYMSSLGGEHPQRRRITLYFKDGLLDRVGGDITPASGRLIVDTRQDMTVEVPGAARVGLIAKIADSIPSVGEDPPKQRPRTAEALAVVDESLPPDAGRDAPAPPQLTPIERAAREEQGGPGVLVRLKEAIPFTGDAADTPTRRATAVAATVTTAADTAADKSAAADGAGQAGTTDASPGLLSRLKSTLPFGGESNDDREQATEEDTYKDADFLESGGQDEEEDAATPDESFRQARLRDDERYEAVAAPPPVAPTAGPLENRIAAPAEEIADEIDVPADATPKKRGFFARLFGRDRPEDTGGDPDARERRRYRDLSDPAAE